MTQATAQCRKATQPKEPFVELIRADQIEVRAKTSKIFKPIWPLNETDLDLPTLPPGEPHPSADLIDAPHFLGALTVRQRGIHGPLSLDILLSVDRSALEIGPFSLDRHGIRWLHRLLSIALAVTTPAAGAIPLPPLRGKAGMGGILTPEAGRGITGWDLAEGLAEGETRP